MPQGRSLRALDRKPPALVILADIAAVPAALVLLASCAFSPERPFDGRMCLTPAQQPTVFAELFFGRGVEGGTSRGEAEWAEFSAQTITPNFPDGFTVIDGEGQWRNPHTGQIAHERSKVLLVAVPPSPDVARRLAAVVEAYKSHFHQQSVGLVTRDACASF